MIYAIDTSGGISAETLDRIVDLVRKRAGPRDRAVFFDTKVHGPFAIDASFGETFYGRGGTMLQPVFDWMAEHAKGEEVLIITDGWFYESGLDHKGVRAFVLLTEDDVNVRMRIKTAIVERQSFVNFEVMKSKAEEAIDRIKETYAIARAHESLSGLFRLDDIEVLLKVAKQ